MVPKMRKEVSLYFFLSFLSIWKEPSGGGWYPLDTHRDRNLASCIALNSSKTVAALRRQLPRSAIGVVGVFEVFGGIWVVFGGIFGSGIDVYYAT